MSLRRKVFIGIIILALVCMAIIGINLYHKMYVIKEYVKQRFSELKAQYQEKQTQGYEVSEVEELAREAQEAYDAGNYEKASELLDNAFTVLTNAKKLAVLGYWNLTKLIGTLENSWGTEVADVDNDGKIEVIVQKDSTSKLWLFALDLDGNILWERFIENNVLTHAGLFVEDIDMDEKLEVVAISANITVLDAQTGSIKWSRYVGTGGLNTRSDVLGKVSDVGKYDIISARTINLTHFKLVAFDPYGNEVFEEVYHGQPKHSASTGDVDDDPYTEIFIFLDGYIAAFDNNGDELWRNALTNKKVHTDFCWVGDLYQNGTVVAIYDHSGGEGTTYVVDAQTGVFRQLWIDVGGHIQSLFAYDFYSDIPGQEIVYVTGEGVKMLYADLTLAWDMSLSGAYMLGYGDWDGDGYYDIVVSTAWRGVERNVGDGKADFVVYDRQGNTLYHRTLQYDVTDWAAVAVFSAGINRWPTSALKDHDGDGRIEVPVCLSRSPPGTSFTHASSDKPVYQYVFEPL